MPNKTLQNTIIRKTIKSILSHASRLRWSKPPADPPEIRKLRAEAKRLNSRIKAYDRRQSRKINAQAKRIHVELMAVQRTWAFDSNEATLKKLDKLCKKYGVEVDSL